MTEEKTVDITGDEAVAETEAPTLTAQDAAQPQQRSLNKQEQIQALTAAHRFFSDFDRVPGSAANVWAQALDTIAVVANSLIAETQKPE